MEECHDLRNQIEELIRKGYLGRYVNSISHTSRFFDFCGFSRDPNLLHDDLICMGNQFFQTDEPKIAFEVGDAKYLDRDDALVVLIRIANAH
ncbi:hypothetical protein GW17_00047551, partial [Ensete ventricosum]